MHSYAPVAADANKVGGATTPTCGIIPLDNLYDFVDKHKGNHDAVRLERTELGRQYCKLCADTTSGVADRPGFYLWGRYDDKRRWWNIYLGKAGYGKTANLKNRIIEELKDERACIWRHVYREDALLGIGAEIHPEMWEKRKYRKGWERAVRKAGATHIAWVATDVKDTDVARVESDLIEALNPKANVVRPAPPDPLQEDTAAILRSLRSTIHKERRSVDQASAAVAG